MANRQQLLEILEELDNAELERFQWYLERAHEWPPIPRSKLQGANRANTVDRMFETYPDEAVRVSVRILQLMNRNDLVSQIQPDLK